MFSDFERPAKTQQRNCSNDSLDSLDRAGDRTLALALALARAPWNVTQKGDVSPGRPVYRLGPGSRRIQR